MTTLAKWNEKLLYIHSFCRFRYDWVEENDGSRYQKQRENPDIVDAPCYISIFKKALGNSYRLDQPNNNPDDYHAVERVLLFFCGLQHDIAAGDVLRVNHGGETIDYIAGKPHKYESYQELLAYSLLDA